MSASRLRHIARRLCNEASSTPQRRASYKSAQELLEDSAIKSMLQQSGKDANERLSDSKTRIAIVAHFCELSGKPVPSKAYSEFVSAADMAEWCSNSLRPVSARPHARNMFMSSMLEGAEDGERTDIGSIHARIDLERDAVEREFLASLPDNLQLDEMTFRKATAVKLRKGNNGRRRNARR